MDDTMQTLLKKLTRQSNALRLVADERKRQDGLWGEQNHFPMLWIGILGEEFGELCQAVNESTFTNANKKHLGGYENMLTEAVQVAAVAVSFVEFLDRRHPGLLREALEKNHGSDN